MYVQCKCNSRQQGSVNAVVGQANVPHTIDQHKTSASPEDISNTISGTITDTIFIAIPSTPYIIIVTDSVMVFKIRIC